MLSAYVDGCCAPISPGGTASYGVVVFKDSEKVWQGSGIVGSGDKMSNNVAEDVRQLVSYAQEANIFLLVDAVLESQTRTAQSTLHRLYQAGASPTYILTMITRQFRLVALASELGSGLSRQELQDKLGLTLNYAVDKTLSQAKMYGFESIKRAYRKLLEMDLAVKTGKCDGQLALELLVAELSASRC